MRQALVGTSAFSYRFELSDLAPDAVEPRARGEVRLLRRDLEGGSGSYLVEVRGTDLGSSTGGGFGGVKSLDEVLVWEDDRQVARTASMYDSGSQLLSRIEPAVLYALFDPESLAEEVELGGAWEGETTVGDEPCDVVRVSYPDDPEDSVWCIGSDDRLPRRLEWIEDGHGSRLDLTDLESLDTLSEADFALVAPGSYRVEESTAGPARGSSVPNFELALAAGGSVSMEALAGEVLVFDFWATWCPPCVASLRSLEETARQLADQPVRFFAVNAMEALERGDPEAFLRDHSVTAEGVLDGDELHAFFAAGNLPALAVVDRRGRLVGVTIGFHGEGSARYVRKLVESALAAE